MTQPSWHSDRPAVRVRPGLLGWTLLAVRAVTMAVVVFGGLGILLVLRLIEWPLFGVRRPLTPYLTVFVCWCALRIIGIRHVVHGTPMKGPGAIVANHVSWIDIYVLNATKRIYFVAKAEVSGWFGIGWLARATGTVFVERNRTKAKAQTQLFKERLQSGHKLLFFPEGTSTDGMQVLPFKSTLFQSFFAHDLRDDLCIQPVTLSYIAPPGAETHYYGWWGDMSFGQSLPLLLSPLRHGRVEVTYHAPLRVRDFDSRKDLAAAAERAVRSAHVHSQITP